MNVDGEVDVETEAAFAAIGAVQVEDSTTGVMARRRRQDSAPAEHRGAEGRCTRPAPTTIRSRCRDTRARGPAPLPPAESQPIAAKQPSVGAAISGSTRWRSRRRTSRRGRRSSAPIDDVAAAVVSSSPPPASSAPPVPRRVRSRRPPAPRRSTALVDELKREVEQLKQKLDELPAEGATAPAAGGFSREREFLNLRETINKKEREVLDLRDAVDVKERAILDGEDKLRDIERKLRDLEERRWPPRRSWWRRARRSRRCRHDKERVVEREKQVKARLDDALKTVTRYEEEIEGWKKQHAADTGVLEQSFNRAVQEHQGELGRLRNEHAQALETQNEQHSSQLREVVDLGGQG